MPRRRSSAVLLDQEAGRCLAYLDPRGTDRQVAATVSWWLQIRETVPAGRRRGDR